VISIDRGSAIEGVARSKKTRRFNKKGSALTKGEMELLADG